MNLSGNVRATVGEVNPQEEHLEAKSKTTDFDFLRFQTISNHYKYFKHLPPFQLSRTISGILKIIQGELPFHRNEDSSVFGCFRQLKVVSLEPQEIHDTTQRVSEKTKTMAPVKTSQTL